MDTTTRRQILSAARLIALPWLAILGACGDDPLGPDAKPAVASVEVSPGTVQITAGEGRVLQAVARAANGSPLSGRRIAWSSSDTSVVAVDAAGNMAARREGTAWVTAAAEGKLGRARVEVSRAAPAVQSIAVTPGDAEVEPWRTRRLTATARMTDGAELPAWAVEWRSSDPSIAYVNGEGTVLGHRGGVVTITATSHGKTAQATIRVSEWRSVSLQSVDEAPLPVTVADSTYYDVNGQLKRRITRLTAGVTRLSTLELTYRQELTLAEHEISYVMLNGEAVPVSTSPAQLRVVSDHGALELDADGYRVFRSAATSGMTFYGYATPAGDLNIVQGLGGEGERRRLLFRH